MCSDKIVIYIDGSSRPNPGKCGWGAHGYRFNSHSVNPRKLNDLYIIETGYVDRSNLNDRPCVEPIEFYDFCVYEPECDSNNAAELYALMRVLQYFKDHELSEIKIYTDSEYVRRGLLEYIDTWEKNNWTRIDGKPFILAETWKIVKELRNSYLERGISFQLEWEKGHADSYGNILADRLASIAALKGHRFETFEDYQVRSGTGYGKAEIERHPFICFKRMYFSSSSDIQDIGRYFIAEPGGDDDDIGRKVTEATYAVIHHKNPDPILEAIKEKQRQVSTDFTRTVMVRLDRLYERSIHPYIAYYGHDCLIRSNQYTGNLDFVDDRNITYEMIPPGLTPRAMDIFGRLEHMLVQYANTGMIGEYQTIDITDVFYDQKTIKDQVQYTLKSEYVVGYKSTSVEVEALFNNGRKTLKVPLLLGGDLLPRNNLKRLESLKPKIILILWPESAQVFQYACVIEVEDAIGIWSNYHSSRVMSAT